ncbi:MAG: hypothetical protein WAM87_05595 [Terriglobales bacterium]|jgi:hypothetical protein
MFKLSCSKGRGSNCRCTNQAPGVELGANGQPGSMAIGNILMVLMKASIAQVRSPKFSTADITKVGRSRCEAPEPDGESKFAAWLFLKFHRGVPME